MNVIWLSVKTIKPHNIGDDALRHNVDQPEAGITGIAGLRQRTGIHHIQAIVILVVRLMRMPVETDAGLILPGNRHQRGQTVLDPLTVSVGQKKFFSGNLNFLEFRDRNRYSLVSEDCCS